MTEQEAIFMPLKDENNDIRYNNQNNNKEDKDKDKEKEKEEIDKDPNMLTLNIKNKVNYRLKEKIKEKEKTKKKEKSENKEKSKNKEINKEKEKDKEKHKDKDKNKEKTENKEPIKNKEISKEKEKERSKEKRKLKQRSSDKNKEIKKNEQSKKRIENQIIGTKTLNNEQAKKTITPNKKVHNFKTIKTQRPSNLTNITKNINLKGIISKFFEQNKNKNLDKLVSAKKNLKIKSNYKTININQYTHNPSQKIKNIINQLKNHKKTSLDKKDKEKNNTFFNTLNTEMNKNRLDSKENKIYKKIKTASKNKKKDIMDDNNKWPGLNTEIIKIKNRNYLDKRKNNNNHINNTLDNIKNNFGYVSDYKKITLNNTINRKKYNINAYINEKKDKKKNRINSNTFSEFNTLSTYNNSIKTNVIHKKLTDHRIFKKLQILTYKGNHEPINSINNYNYSNRKSNYESEISDNNVVKTEPSSEFFTKLNNRDTHFNHIKNNTNTIETSKINRGLYPKKLNYNYPATYFLYLNNIKKVKKYHLTKNNNNLIKNIPNNDLLKNENNNKEKKLIIPKNNRTTISSKKNSFVTIRNTVINFNMIHSGIILPPFNKKTQKKGKSKLTNQYNNQLQNITNKKNVNQRSEFYNQITYNTSINKKLNINNCGFKSLFKTKTTTNTETKKKIPSLNNNIINSKEIINTINQKRKGQTIAQEKKISTITSFNKLINKMKNKQLLNKRHSNSVEKNNNIFKGIRLNDYYFKNMKQKNEKKKNNTSGTLNTINKDFKTLNVNKNFTLPSFENKIKKLLNPLKNGFSVQTQGKTLKTVNSLKPNNNNENNKE